MAQRSYDLVLPNKKMAKRRKTNSASYKKVIDTTTAPSSYKVKNRKAVAVRVPKKIKVSPKLKAKIMKVINKKVLNITGSVTDHYIGGSMACIDREQNVVSKAGSTRPSGWHFTVPAFHDAASVLFNNKLPTNDATVKYRLGQAGGFNSKNITYEVKNSYSVYTFKNNTQHQVTLKLLIAVPKRKGGTLEWLPNQQNGQTAEGGSAAAADAFTDLPNAWQFALDQDTFLGTSIQGFSPHGVSLPSGVVLQNPNIADIFRLPTNSRSFNNLYKCEIITLEMLPGQTVNHTLQGPKGLNIDMAKMYVNNLCQSVQKYSRNVAAIVYNSPNAIANVITLTGASTGAVTGRFADKVDNADAGFDIHVECMDHFTIVMPEQTGFVYPTDQTPGVTQTLGQRRSRTNYNVYDKAKADPPSQATTQIIDLSVMNPQQPVQAGPGTGT